MWLICIEGICLFQWGEGVSQGLARERLIAGNEIGNELFELKCPKCTGMCPRKQSG